MKSAILLMLSSLAAAAATPTMYVGDWKKGEEFFHARKCDTCHLLAGKGGKSAPDLSRRGKGAFTPASLSAAAWNHLPGMWRAMDREGMKVEPVSAEQVGDLFAYLYAARFFEKSGDPAKGRKAFIDKGCADCHNLSSANAGGGDPVMKWEAVTDPVELARQMWNHSSLMQEAATKKNKPAPQVTAEEMSDILGYLQNLPQAKSMKPAFEAASAGTGAALFSAKGCDGCHKGVDWMASKPQIRSQAELAASMWNHSAKMKQQGELRPEEMKRLVGYAWSLQFEGKSAGDPAKGESVYKAKACASCHDQGKAPKVTDKKLNAYSMTAQVWTHGPAMKQAMGEQAKSWPKMSEAEMTDLLAYLRGAN
jgi:cytochrome c551/c552